MTLPPQSVSSTPPTTIRVLFYQGRDKLSRLIRWRTWSDGPSHVALLLPNGREVLHARPLRGVLIEPLTASARIGTRIDLLYATLPEADADRLWAFAKNQVGKPYDWLGNAGFVIRKDIHGRTSWFCSELIAWLFWSCGHPLLARTPSWKYAPEDCWRAPRLQVGTAFYLDRDPTGNPFLRLTTPKATQKPSDAFSAPPPSIYPQGPENQNARRCRKNYSHPRANPANLSSPEAQND